MTHPEPPLAGDETATLLGSLERVRTFLEWKCGGVDAAGLQVKLGHADLIRETVDGVVGEDPPQDWVSGG